MKYIKIFLLAIVALLGYGFYTPAQTTATNTSSAMTASSLQSAGVISAAQVSAAGFTKVAAILPTATKYELPVYYFRVGETVPTSTGWGDARNIVAVLVVAKIDKTWTFNAGEVEVKNLDGRTQARLTTAQNYIVVTGPDRFKTAALAASLQASF